MTDCATIVCQVRRHHTRIQTTASHRLTKARVYSGSIAIGASLPDPVLARRRQPARHTSMMTSHSGAVGADTVFAACVRRQSPARVAGVDPDGFVQVLAAAARVRDPIVRVEDLSSDSCAHHARIGRRTARRGSVPLCLPDPVQRLVVVDGLQP